MAARVAAAPDTLLLTPDDAVDVLEDLLPAQNQSYELGLKLRLQQHEVESIHSTHSKPCTRLLHVVIKFLKQAEPKPSWRVIVDALRSPVINLQQLAKQVETARILTPTSSHDLLPDQMNEVAVAVGQNQLLAESAETAPTSSSSSQANEAITPSPQPSLSPAAERTEAVSTPSCVSSSDVADEALTNRPQRPASPIPNPMTLRYVQAKIKQFEKRFNTLKIGSRECLKKMKITINQVADALMSLPADDIDEHKQFLEANLKVIYQAVDHYELIGVLSLNMNYLSYHLLDYLISEFNLEVKREMNAYKIDLQRFRESTPLTLFCNTQKKKRRKPPPDFQEMVAEFEWPQNVTLEIVEQFRQECVCHYKLRDCALMLAEVRPGSFIITWFIPESIVDKLKDNLPGDILKKYKASKVDIAGSCVYRLRKNQTRSSLATAVSLPNEASSSTLEAVSDESDVSLGATSTDKEYRFVKCPSDDLVCPVTCSLLLQPHLTSCCGNHLSQECAIRIQAEGGVCPLCKVSNWSTVLNKHFQRQVKTVSVFCLHENRGCGWQGELSEFERHVKSCLMQYEPDQLESSIRDEKKIHGAHYQEKSSAKDSERIALQSTESPHMVKSTNTSEPVKLSVQCQPMKPTIGAMRRGSATTDNQFAYFMSEKSNSIYAFEWKTEKWEEFAIARYRYSTLVMVDGELTTVGGLEARGGCVTSQLLTLRERQWVEEYPPMHTARSDTAVISARDNIIVIGGISKDWTTAVELFQVKTRRWYELKSLPKPCVYPSATLCGCEIYVTNDNACYSCSIQNLPLSDTPIAPQSAPQLVSWKSLPRLPVKQSTAATLCGQLVLVGGLHGFSSVNSIHQLVAGQWVEIGKMSSSRTSCLVANLAPNKLIIVGGGGAYDSVEECIVDM